MHQFITVDVELPTKEIRQSFTKLFELCCPESSLQYEEMDSRFYSLLEHTKWMLLISKSLHIANYAGRLITENQDFIILQGTYTLWVIFRSFIRHSHNIHLL